jgi:type II secretory pathway pseudopilin PulG
MLRAIFGLLGLLIVLAIVSKLGATQLSALGLSGRTATRAANQGEETKAVTDAVMGRAGVAGGTGGAATIAVPGGMPGAAPAGVEGTVPYQAQTIQNNVRDATKAALEKGVDRSNAALP